MRLAEPGGRAVERSLTLPITPTAPMIGVKPLFSGKSLGEGDNATFDVAMVSSDGKMLDRKGLRYELLKVETRYQWYRQGSSWEYEPTKLTRRDGRRPRRCRRRQAGPHLAAGRHGAATGSRSRPTIRAGR